MLMYHKAQLLSHYFLIYSPLTNLTQTKPCRWFCRWQSYNIASSADRNLTFLYVQNHLHLLEVWYREWRLKMNESKSTHCTFTLRHGTSPTLFLNNQTLPNAQCERYLGIYIDHRFTWMPRIKNKIFALNYRFRLLQPLLTAKKKNKTN